ncbi:hypothetical protein [Singulisphaera acidiphila]|uniref:Uncharacterized protein n=1 Tax=Singulisphaera acidiphila (strain ATCC BAA-1392 / DSM 18658 / VKM B-2454 / MOB10) TaxID=886293 RepID=L0DIN1_SINAD|nr:hypothetical protein [Singulisphaera acidiphila]AGA29117.1 hypothetical protein Sinac_4961 [Singulisphaera acidiphila DSM 18658]
MSRRVRSLEQKLGLESLEARLALSAPELPGNTGEVIQSQFAPFGFTKAIGLQASQLAVGGPIQFDLQVLSNAPETSGGTRAVEFSDNSGLIGYSQFSGGGFATVGMQIKQSRLGRGLTIHGFDIPENELETRTGALSQEPDQQSRVNANLVLNSQFNDNGFGTPVQRGRVGFQWRKVRVRGQVNVGLKNLVFQPDGPEVDSALPPQAQSLTAAGEDVDIRRPTNTGRIRHSQFNDGGFGDLGFQWANVAVGGRVATSTNTLSLKPKQNNLGPITFKDLDFGRSSTLDQAVAQAIANPSALSTEQDSVPSADPTTKATVATSDTPVQSVNDATNSGRIAGAQFNDGGFGDVGLQWRRVKVGKTVSAVHNALSVQPTNTGQGLITVENVQFPSIPAPEPLAPKQPIHVLAPTPAVVKSDGKPLGRKLPTPTDPLRPLSQLVKAGHLAGPAVGDHVPFVDAATNSGLIRAGQFNAGGFGDLGLQWLNVRVGEGVELVHNSLSVQPEGAKLEGVNVSNVTYGAPISPQAKRSLSVLPTTVITPSASGGFTQTINENQGDGTRNDRWLKNQQVASLDGTSVFLQWNGVVKHRGLVIIQNVIQIHDLGPESGPLTLEDIHFPGRVPLRGRDSGVSDQAGVWAARVEPIGVDSTNNSGILSHNQFNDGGFGGLGLQWRNVQVAGQVALVRNTLSVNLSKDTTPADAPGPVTVSNITFNSGALDQVPGQPLDQRIITLPPHASRLSIHPRNRGLPLPHDPRVIDDATNSGIIRGGQFASGGAGYGLLQWRGVKIPGKVTVIQNVLEINMGTNVTGPVTVSHVIFR